MSKARLWVASELYYPEETSTGYFLTRIAEGLAADYEVHVICGHPSYSERNVKVARKEIRKGVMIHRLSATRFDKDRLALRLINVISFSIASFFFALASISRGDRLLVVTNPPFLPVVVGFAASLRGAKSVLLLHDVYPDILAATEIISRKNIFYRVLDAFFNRTLKFFDRIVVLGRDMQSVIGNKLGYADNIRIIPNWADIDEVFPLPDRGAAFRREHGLQGKAIIQFSGNIGRTHNVEALLAAAEELRNERHLHLLFVGYGGKAKFVEEQIKVRKLDNLTFLSRQPREMLNQMLNASELTIISLSQSMTGLSVPSRLYNVMSAGIPILTLTTPDSELALMVEENDAGWVVDISDKKTLIEHLREVGSEEWRKEALRRGGNGRKAVEARYRFDDTLDAYRRLFLELL
jgi:colanic acid biosynthesis glycosyl transferase WcaI